jgi:hypothetical protein
VAIGETTFEIEIIDDKEGEATEELVVHLSVRHDGSPVRMDVRLEILDNDQVIL